MHTDFNAWLNQHRGRRFDLHTKHVNPSFVKMLKTIGFDKEYVRGTCGTRTGTSTSTCSPAGACSRSGGTTRR
jgi:hypothetical protein